MHICAFYDNFLYLLQLNTDMALKVEIIYHRRRLSYVISTTAADVLAMQGANSINSHDINRFFPECSASAPAGFI